MTTLIPTRRFLFNGVNRSFNVSGTLAVPVDFTYTPPAGQIFMAVDSQMSLIGNGTISQPITDFWTFTALTNGIQTEVQLNGVLYTSPNLIKTNADLITLFGIDFLGKVIGTRNIADGTNKFYPNLTLVGDRGDFFRLRIRDNLSTIEQATFSIRGAMIVP